MATGTRSQIARDQAVASLSGPLDRGRRTPPAAASTGSIPWAQNAPMIPLRTSPVPAVARRASPVAVSSTRPRAKRPRWSTLQQHHRTQARRQIAGGPDAIVTDRLPGETLVLRLVGGEDRTVGSRGAPARLLHRSQRTSPSPSTTTATGALATSW